MSPKAKMCQDCRNKQPYERTPEHKARMSEALTGVPKPSLRGRKRPDVGRKIAAAWTDEMKEAAKSRGLANAERREWLVKIAVALSGEANPNYQGKGQESPYAPGWGRTYRAKIRARAGGICEKCGKAKKKLEPHHKDFLKVDHSPENLIVVCRSCHKLMHYAEKAKSSV